GRGKLLLGLAELLLDLLELLDLLRPRLAVDLLARPELGDLRDEPAPAVVGGEPRVERLGRALARERCPVGVRVVARGLRVDQAGTTGSGSGRRPGRTAASWAGPRTSSASRSGSRTR